MQNTTLNKTSKIDKRTPTYSISTTPIKRKSSIRLQSGFTLVELMVTIAISAILIGVALPSLGGYLAGMRANTEVREIQRLLLTTRSAAINSGANAELCPLADDDTCTDGSDWSGRIGIVTAADGFILEREGVEGNDELKFSGTTVIYGPTGMLQNGADSIFSYCPKNYEEYSRGVELSITGRSYASVDINSDGKDQDRDGTNITCN